MNFTSTQNPEEALTLALTLSLTASDDVKAQECTDMADSIAETIERCKQRALTISQEVQ